MFVWKRNGENGELGMEDGEWTIDNGLGKAKVQSELGQKMDDG